MVIRDLSQSGPTNRGGSYVTDHSHQPAPSGGHRLTVTGPEGAITQVLLTDRHYIRSGSFVNVHRLDGVGPGPTAATSALLKLLRGTVIVPCGDLVDFAIALDWYNKIVDEKLGAHTDLADLVHRGKYWYKADADRQREVGLKVADEITEFIGQHPLLKDVDMIASVPGHDARVSSFGARVAATVARDRGNVPIVRCESIQAFRAPAKSLHPADRAAALEGQFRCPVDISGQNVLIVDDVYTTGATAQETARALRAAGARAVASLAAVRTMKSG
ncbi:Orotate phosphoribosyltransferase [Mycobacterium simulans]|uniref:Orotate phosphoribosyltransferase n=1 Tax=Mycobacterium simulans TaxID=627089 RepID=A0A7Z7NDF9_9MYCO|nr:phosphoribosyltransferase family protein [Mycobacterium simulans]SOJ58171.1 Orotate phosphoribosyltransferase [Mycobacterium simulans]